MRPRMVPVQAATAQEAAIKAANLLETSPDNIIAEPSDAHNRCGRFEARVINCDAELEIVIADNNMTAIIVNGAPALGSGRALDGPMLVELLRAKGVVLPPETEVAKKVLRTLSKGHEVSNVVIARGIPAVPAQNAKVDPLGDWQFPVFPNDGIGRLIPATLAKPGKDLSGNPIQPSGPERGRGINLVEKGGCFIDQTSLVIRSDRFGLATQSNQDLYVSSSAVLKVSKDSMEVLTTIYPKDFRGNPITIERMRSALAAEDLGGNLDQNALIKAIKEAEEKSAAVKNVVICRGIEPQPGVDGWFEMVAKDNRLAVGMVDEVTGRIDFRARGVVRSVKAGEFLGKLHLPQKGVPGRDVYNKVIPAREGSAFNLQIAESVTASPDETEFHAAVDGMVFFVGNHLSVTDVFTTRGDVNMATGNIAIEKGSVHVRGSILSGFAVESPGNILVDEVIESCQVKAGGDIEVRGGILMDTSGGKITAKGGISALYAKNATIASGGDVNIAHELSNCIVFAANKVLAVKGRGKIIGSTVRAGKGVEAQEIGSDLGVETTIFLGIERRSFAEELAKKRKIQNILQHIYATLGSDSPRAILERTAPKKRQAVASLLKARLRGEQAIKTIEEELEQERERVRRAVQARVKVHKTIHPGTVINCFGSTLKISEAVHSSQVYYDPKEQKVVIANL